MPILFRRSDDASTATASASPSSSAGADGPSSATMIHLLIALIILVCIAVFLGGALFFVRRARRSRKAEGTLPSYDAATRDRNSMARDSTFVYSEKQNLINSSSPMPQSPDTVPEIRITFPEEEDGEGRRVSGKVMVVQMGEAGVGYVKPLPDQNGLPPAYQQSSERQFASVDLDRYGGLKEVS